MRTYAETLAELVMRRATRDDSSIQDVREEDRPVRVAYTPDDPGASVVILDDDPKPLHAEEIDLAIGDEREDEPSMMSFFNGRPYAAGLAAYEAHLAGRRR